MIRVRFDTGLVLQYNDAVWIENGVGYADLWTSREKVRFVAQVPSNCVVESVVPCRVYREGEAVNGAQIEALTRRNVRLQRMNRELRAKAKTVRRT